MNIEKWLNRTLEVTAYDEILDGPGCANLLLNNYPIVEIDCIAFNPTQVLSIRNTDNTIQRASFRIDGDNSTPPKPANLYLVSMKNGVQTSHTTDLTTTPTLASVATAINTYSANGWLSQALGVYSTWATADLYPLQGAKECRWFGNANVKFHSWNLMEFDFNPDAGEIVSPMGFTCGYRNYRVLYTAGYTTIPEAIQQATAALAVSVYEARGQNANLTAENLGGYSYTAIAEKNFKSLDIASRYTLALYKNWRINKYKVIV